MCSGRSRSYFIRKQIGSVTVEILKQIRSHGDMVKLSPAGRKQLCEELRRTLIDKVSKTGGHLASNLGVVELTVALETVFDTNIDRLVFDVGHQSYVHKLLTGRQADFEQLRQFGGLAGFPKPSESISDAFTAGHASTSVSVALGMARARTLQNEDYHVIALMGDGAATGGTAYEGLNDAAVSKEPLIVILNDNAMSIEGNVGGMAKHLSKLRSKARYISAKERSKERLSKVPGGGFISRTIHRWKKAVRRMLLPPTIFESMGFTYLGPMDGHDTENLIQVLGVARAMKKPVLIHVTTQKGKGYRFAQKDPSHFHGVGRFDPATGELLSSGCATFSDAFGSKLTELAGKDPRICAITAAMPGGTGLTPFKEKFPERTFDVGIAEEHAVSMAGGLAKQGMTPVVAIYSTFLQRAYDMILQDVCMQKLHVVFAIDRGGLVGEDGETHHGVFDVAFLCGIPNLTVLSPANRAELQDMLEWATQEASGPVAIRYPRGGDGDDTGSAWGPEQIRQHRDGTDAVFVTYGTMLQSTLEAADILEKQGISVGVVRLMTLSPLPVEALKASVGENKTVFVPEEICHGCGICAAVSEALPACRVIGCNLGDRFIPHGAVETLKKHYGLDGRSLAKTVQEVCGQ